MATKKIDQTQVDGLVTDLAGKQPVGSYALTGHSHVVADVTGLQGALDGKLATSHEGAGGAVHANVVAAGAAGFMTGADKTKLDGIATGATANQTNAFLLDRANHTGTQAQSTVTNLTTDLAAKANTTDVVLLTGNQTIAGTKTFSSAIAGSVTGSAATLTTSRNFSISGGGITAAAVGFNGSAAVVLSASVDAGHITLARMANLAANSIIGNNTGAGATPLALTGAQVKTMLALTKADVGLSAVDNTSDADKPVSTAMQTALNLKANLASPTLTGTPTAPTAAGGTNTTQIATTQFVQSAISGATAGVSSFNTRTGAVTLTSGDVTTALTYTPTSVTGLTGTQSVAAFKTGLSLVKGDVGLGLVDNTADASKNVASAATLTTGRNFSISGGGITAAAVSFNGSGAVVLSASVDAGHVTLARMANLAANSFIGNNTGAGATPLALTVTQATAMLNEATVSLKGLMSSADKTKLDGVATGATANATDAALRDRATHTGAQAISTVTGLQTALDGKAATSHTHAQSDVTNLVTDLAGKLSTAHEGAGGTVHANVVAGGAAGFMTGADKTKLDGIAAGATVNATDAQLRDRATHTGSQAQSTITNLTTDLAAKANDADVVKLAGAQTITGAKTFSAKITAATSSAGAASLNLPHGTAPTSPANGDVWTTTDGVYARINGATVGPLGAGGAESTPGWSVTATGTGSSQNITIPEAVTAASVLVFVSGVYQRPTTHYTISGTTLTLTALSGDNISIIKPAGAQGATGDTGPSALWGTIGGTLSNQTDLQTALNAKLNTSQTVPLSAAFAGSTLALNGGGTLSLDYATQAQAEAGADNTKAMTALRTAQAIAALTPPASAGSPWETISTSTAAISPVTFSGISTDYTDLMVVFEGVTTSLSAITRVELSANGTNWSAPPTNIGTSTSGAAHTIFIPGVRQSYGQISARHHVTSGAPTNLTLNAVTMYEFLWRIDEGITAVRVSRSAGTFNGGTIRLMGRK
jgi:hypothetical protein